MARRKPSPFTNPLDSTFKRVEVSLDWSEILDGSISEEVRWDIEQHLGQYLTSINRERTYPEDFDKLAKALQGARNHLARLPASQKAMLDSRDVDGFERLLKRVMGLRLNKFYPAETLDNKIAGKQFVKTKPRPREPDYWDICVQDVAFELQWSGISIKQPDISSSENLSKASEFQLAMLAIFDAAEIERHRDTEGAFVKAVSRALKDK